MLTGATVAQILPLLFLPVITRLFTPDEIGVFAAFTSLFVILTAFMTAKYEFAILLPKRDTDAEQLFYLSMGISIATTFFAFVIILLWGERIALFFNAPEYINWLYLLPLSILGYSVFSCGSYYLNRFKNYKSIASAKVSQASSMSVAQVGFGYLQFTTLGMIAGKVIGDMVIAITTLWHVTKVRQAFRAGISYGRIRHLAWKYRSFPFYNAPHALFNATSNNVAILVYSRFFGEAETGYYSVATRLTFGPIRLIAQSLMQVFSREISERHNRQEDIYRFFKKTVGYLALAGIAPCILAWFVSPALLAFVLGEEWRVSGEIIRLILPWVFLVMVVSPVTFIPALLNRQRKAMIIDLVYMLLRFTALYIGIHYHSITLAIAAYAAIGVIVQLYLLIWIASLAKHASQRTNFYPE